jgi:predicted AAA+ superfamily ATPase
LPARSQDRKPLYPAKTYRIDPNIAARLKAWAALNKRTEQAVVEELIREFLERVGG